MNIVINTEKAYKLSELAEAVQTSDDDLIYLVQNINGQETSIAIRRDAFLAGILPQGKALISGGASYSGIGLIFNVSDLVYRIDGVIYSTQATTVTLNPGDPTDPRFDLIVVDNNGLISVIEGTPSPNPVYPPLGINQVLVAPVLIAAGATTPTVITEVVYKEDVEWTTAIANLGNPQTGTIDFQSTNNPYQGTFCVEYATNRNSGAAFTRSPINLGDYSIFSCWIFLPANQPNNSNISVIAVNGVNQVGTVNLNTQGLQRTTTGVWQQVVFPVSLFGASIITSFVIRYSQNTVYTFRIDNIELQSGQIIAPSNTISIRKDGTLIGSTPQINFVEGANISITAVQQLNGTIDVTINGGAGGGGQVNSIVGTASQIDVNSTDPVNPVLSLNTAVTASLALADTSVQSVQAGTNVTIDNTNPASPIINVSAGGQVNTVVGTVNEINVNNTDPVNPVLSLASAVTNALVAALTAVQPGANITVFVNNAGYVNAAGAAAAAPVQSVAGTAVGGTSANPIINIPDEDDITGNALYDATLTGTYNLDLSTFTAFYGVLTGNTIITVSNTPASGDSFVRSLKIASSTTQSLTLPVTWEVIGTYAADGTVNDIQIEFSNFPTVGLTVTAYINQWP